MHRLIAALVALSLALLFTACGGDETASTAAPDDKPAATTFPLTVDSCGEAITVSEQPEEVLAVGAAPVNLLAAAGAGDRVIGLAGEQIPEPSVSGVDAPVLTREEPSTEAIIGTGADIVISYGLFGANPENLEQSGIASIINRGNCDHGEAGGISENITYETIYDDIETYGKLFGTQDQAAASIAKLKERVATVTGEAKAKTEGGPPMTAAALYFFGGKLSSNAGRESIIHLNMEAAGLENVYADVDKVFLKPSAESLLKRDPEVIVLTYGYSDDSFAEAKKELLAVPGIRDTQALKNDRVIGLPAQYAEADPLAVESIETIVTALGRE
jgi:iron complex transport system substrate-binding protein